MKQLDVKLQCVIYEEDYEDDEGNDSTQYVIWVSLVDRNAQSTLLEASDITAEIFDYLDINEYYKIYKYL